MNNAVDDRSVVLRLRTIELALYPRAMMAHACLYGWEVAVFRDGLDLRRSMGKQCWAVGTAILELSIGVILLLAFFFDSCLLVLTLLLVFVDLRPW